MRLDILLVPGFVHMLGLACVAFADVGNLLLLQWYSGWVYLYPFLNVANLDCLVGLLVDYLVG